MLGPVVVKGASCLLFHVPSLVVHGSKPSREIKLDGSVKQAIAGHLRSFDDAVAYGPNQAFIGNIHPRSLFDHPAPWWEHLLSAATRAGPFGDIVPEVEFWGLLKLADDFNLVHLDRDVAERAGRDLGTHPLISSADIARITGTDLNDLEMKATAPENLALYDAAGRLAAVVLPGHPEDVSQSADILLENFAAKASGMLAVRHLLGQTGTSPDRIQYLLGCGEEAVGDRYQRGGGNLAKAIAEVAGLQHATGADVKAFCCAPVHATVMGGALIAAGVHDDVVIVGGGSLPKLGMKFRGALSHEIPVLEDCLAAVAIQLGPDTGDGDPRLRLDVVGKHDVGVGSSQRSLYESLVLAPLLAAGLSIPDVDRYAVELHNAEIMEAGGSGNVSRTNYRMIASLAAMAGQITRDDVSLFERAHGLPGYVATQGHVPAAIPYVPHARREMRAGTIQRAMFVAKGSLFLGKMTDMADGMSFMLEAAPR
jgi:glycine/sarcosine/betaine reductase complex component C subunit beta